MVPAPIVRRGCCGHHVRCERTALVPLTARSCLASSVDSPLTETAGTWAPDPSGGSRLPDRQRLYRQGRGDGQGKDQGETDDGFVRNPRRPRA
jgi:hypothetical protein